jgi:hypothetical protein
MATLALSLYFHVSHFPISFKSSGKGDLGIIAQQEADEVWPNRKLDIHLKLGTSLEWRPGTSSEWRPGTIGLAPGYLKEFAHNDVQRISQISNETTSWLKYHKDVMVRIANHLIAGLFFFTRRPSSLSGILAGEISCRLPLHLEERTKLVAHLSQVSEFHCLFVIRCHGKVTKIGAHKVLAQLRHGQNLAIQVNEDIYQIKGSEVEIDVKMTDIFDYSGVEYSISGSPFLVQTSLPSLGYTLTSFLQMKL